MKLVVNSRGISNVERFYELFFNFDSLKEDQKEYPNVIFAFKENKYYWDFNKKTGSLWLSYKFIWSKFENEYNLNYNDIQIFIKYLVEKHFNSKDATPTPAQYFEHNSGGEPL